eukprot:Em0429g8a
MGLFDKLANWLGWRKQQAKVLCIGLDNSGKTTIINALKPQTAKATTIVPTIGFNVEVFSHANISFTVFDMSGQGRYRTLWEHYYKETEAIIFVIDSSDKLRIPVAKDELDLLLQNADMAERRVPILFLANKMDLKDSYSAPACFQLLKLDQVKDRSCFICPTNGLTGMGWRLPWNG